MQLNAREFMAIPVPAAAEMQTTDEAIRKDRDPSPPGMGKNLSYKRRDVGLDAEQCLTVDFEIYLPFGDCVVTRNMHISP